jgi:hypothetical protein
MRPGIIDALTQGPGPFGSAIPLYAPGVPPRLATLAAERIALLHTRRLGGQLVALDRSEIGFMAGMYRAAGRRYTLALQGMISPLRLNPEMLGHIQGMRQTWARVNSTPSRSRASSSTCFTRGPTLRAQPSRADTG